MSWGPPTPTDLETGGPCHGHGVSILQPHQQGAGSPGGVTGQPNRAVEQHGAREAGRQRDARGHCRARMTRGTG